MRPILRLTISWLFVLTIVLLVAHNGFEASLVKLQKEQLTRDVKALRTLLESQTWPAQPDTSQNWKQIAEDFSVGMVATEVPQATRPPSRDVSLRLEGDRLVALAPAELSVRSNLRDGEARRATFTINVSRLRSQHPLWPWLLIGLFTTTLGVGTVSFSAFRAKRRERRRSEEIHDWVDSVVRASDSFPPKLAKLADPSELASNLNIVAERMNEITNRLHNSQQRNELVLSNLREGVLAVDAQSRVLLVNRALDDHLNLATQSYLYRPLVEVVRVPQVCDIVQQVQQTSIAREEVAEILGTAHWLRITARPMTIGTEMGVLITTRDETLVKRIEAVRKDFIANASHELKTPLAAIRAYAETLQLGAIHDREAADNFIASIITQADRINGLIHGMLQLSRVESGSGLHIEQLDACKAIQPVLAATQAMARSQDIELTWKPEAPCMIIESDRDGFQTIASNLLSNAIRYTPAGGHVAVFLNKSQLDDGQPACEFIVEDNGRGIHTDDLERIFERFYRAEKDRSNETGGTGLGLSIVKHLTNALGGNVTATSTLGKGSRFVVRLPMRPPHNS